MSVPTPLAADAAPPVDGIVLRACAELGKASASEDFRLRGALPTGVAELAGRWLQAHAQAANRQATILCWPPDPPADGGTRTGTKPAWIMRASWQGGTDHGGRPVPQLFVAPVEALDSGLAATALLLAVHRGGLTLNEDMVLPLPSVAASPVPRAVALALLLYEDVVAVDAPGEAAALLDAIDGLQWLAVMTHRLPSRRPDGPGIFLSDVAVPLPTAAVELALGPLGIPLPRSLPIMSRDPEVRTTLLRAACGLPLTESASERLRGLPWELAELMAGVHPERSACLDRYLALFGAGEPAVERLLPAAAADLLASLRSGLVPSDPDLDVIDVLAAAGLLAAMPLAVLGRLAAVAPSPPLLDVATAVIMQTRRRAELDVCSLIDELDSWVAAGLTPTARRALLDAAGLPADRGPWALLGRAPGLPLAPPQTWSDPLTPLLADAALRPAFWDRWAGTLTHELATWLVEVLAPTAAGAVAGAASSALGGGSAAAPLLLVVAGALPDAVRCRLAVAEHADQALRDRLLDAPGLRPPLQAWLHAMLDSCGPAPRPLLKAAELKAVLPLCDSVLDLVRDVLSRPEREPAEAPLLDDVLALLRQRPHRPLPPPTAQIVKRRPDWVAALATLPGWIAWHAVIQQSARGASIVPGDTPQDSYVLILPQRPETP